MTPEQLKEWRADMGLNQREAADLVRRSERTWQRWESGETPIDFSMETLLAIIAEPVVGLKWHEKLFKD